MTIREFGEWISWKSSDPPHYISKVRWNAMFRWFNTRLNEGYTIQDAIRNDCRERKM